MNDPNAMELTSWWSDGPPVGVRNAAGLLSVIGGHTQVGGYGVFNDIGSMPLGTPVTFTDTTGVALRLYVVKVVTGIRKDDSTALQKALHEAPVAAVSVLMTCSGSLANVPGYGKSHPDNTLVFLGLEPPSSVGK